MEKPVRSKNYPRLLAIVALVLLECAGCYSDRTIPFSNTPTAPADNWLRTGSISLFNPIPVPLAIDQARLLGFLPASIIHTGNWLLIDTQKRTVALMEGGRSLTVADGQNIPPLKHGTYQLMLKQRSPLWYAPDSYFTSRNLPVPPAGDRSRYLRGAYGDFAIFITKKLPLHSSAIFDPEVGGIRIDENDLAQMYYSLPLGAAIEVH